MHEPRDLRERGFAQRLTALREAAGLTKTALAAGRYTVSYISQLESGRRVPSRQAVAWLAERLGVSPGLLARGVPEGLEQELAYAIERAAEHLRGDEPTLALGMLAAVLRSADDHGLVRLRARARLFSAHALLALGRHREAIDRYEEALEEGLTERERGMATAALARVYRAVGDLAYAVDVAESFLSVPRSAPLDAAVRAELYTALVSIYFERGDMVRAQRSASRAVAAAEESADPLVRANSYWDAARVHAESRSFDEALDLATRARVLLEDLDDRRRLGRLHNVQAFLCLEHDPPRLGDASEHLDAAERLLGDLATAGDIAYLSTERARLALLGDDPAAALVHARRAGEHAGTDELERARALFLEGRSLAALDRLDDASGALREAAYCFHKLGARQQEASCWRELGEAQTAAGLTAEALESMRTGLALLDPSRSRA